MYDLFAHMTLDEQGGAAGGRAFKMDRRGGGAKKKATVSSQFKVHTAPPAAIDLKFSGISSFSYDRAGTSESVFRQMYQTEC